MMDEHDGMEGVELEQDDEEFVEEPMAADFDYVNANDPIALDEPISHGNEEVKPPSIVEVARIDLDTYSNEYTDYALMNRLLFIADVCPPLKAEALKMLISYITKNTQNVPMLNAVYQRVDAARAENAIGIEKVPNIDKTWIEVTAIKGNQRLENLLAEFKRQKDEAVKESIRRALEDLFRQYVLMGNLQEALKLYGRGMREYCTAPNQIIQMLINWINVSVYAEQWPKLFVLLPQADRAIGEVIERENMTGSATVQPSQSFTSSGGATIAACTLKNQKELILSSRAKIQAVYGLAYLHDKNYKMAAEKFMQVDLDVLDYKKLLSPTDVAVYGTICALATFNRMELKDKLLGSTLFRKSLESDPKLIELLQKFCKNQFGSCLDILYEMRDQLLLNIYLASHITTLFSLIRESAIIQYFEAYLTSNINQMAQEFRTTAELLETELIGLIEKNKLKAKIDSYNKVLHAKFSDNRSENYERIMKLRQHLNQQVKATLIRTALLNHKIHEQK